MSNTLADRTGPLPGDLDQRIRHALGQRFRIDALDRRGPGSLVYQVSSPDGAPLSLKVIPLKGRDERLVRGAATAAGMEHPHIVPVLESGETDRFFWYTMPRVDGRSLDRIIQEDGPLGLKQCRGIVEQIASALQYGHRRGIVHGGLKTENVIVNRDGWTLVTDFGIPGAWERLGASGHLPDRLRAYAPPESLEFAQQGPASDQYALAVLIHECLTGAPPVTPGATDVAPPTNPRVALPRASGGRTRPDGAEQVMPALRRAMSPSPQDRFPTVLSFVTSLDGNPAPATITSFAPAPSQKPEPRVLTMEPESRTGRKALWAGLLMLVVGGVLAGSRLLETPTFRKYSDRFDPWYEPDAPPGGIVMGGPAREPARIQPPAETGTVPTTPVEQPREIAATPRPQATAPRPQADATRPVASRPPTPRPQATRPAATPPAAVVTSTAPGRLLVSSTPWGTLYVDGRRIGNTPLRDVSLAPGSRWIRITHEGYEPYEALLEVEPGQLIRLVGIQLQEATQ